MNDDAQDTVPRFARGVRFRRLDDGAGVLLVPEGVVNLTETASAVAQLIDGMRSTADIAQKLSQAFDAQPDRICADVCDLVQALAQKTWVEVVRKAPS